MFRSGFVFVLTLVLSFSVMAHARADFEVKLRCDFDKAMEAGGYDSVHPLIKKEYAPKTACKENQEVSLTLFRFDVEAIGTDEILKTMKEAKCRAATWPELFALGAEYPWLQLQERVVALGSVWTSTVSPTVLTLDRTEKERTLQLYDSGIGWSKENWAFAAICDLK